MRSRGVDGICLNLYHSKCGDITSFIAEQDLSLDQEIYFAFAYQRSMHAMHEAGMYFLHQNHTVTELE